MSDNTTLNTGAGGDVIRTIAKAATSAKTQVVVLDVGGGADGSPESAWTGAVSISGQLPGFASPPAVAQSGAWSMAATQSGVWSVAISGAVTVNGSVSISNFPATQPVSLVSVPTHAVTQSGGPWTVSWSGQSISVSNFPATQAISAAALPLPTGAALEAGNLATVASAQGVGGTGLTQPTGGSGVLGWLSGIYTALKGTIATSRTWTLSSGSDSISATIANASLAVTGTFFQATQPVSAASLPLPAGAATAALQPALNGDGGALAHITNLPATQAVSAVALPLPAGAAQEAGNLATLVTVHGAITDAAYAGTGSSGVIAALKGIYAKLAGTLTVTFSGSPSVTVANASIPVTGSFFQATQPVSATALPLPAGAALEAGNLATIATAAGAPADAAYAGSGSPSIIAALKGIYSALKATLTIAKSTGAATLAITQVAIGTSATAIVAARTGAPGTGRIAALIYNFGSSTVYVGNAGVTNTTGFPLLAGASIGWDTTAALYGVVASGSGSVACSETY